MVSHVTEVAEGVHRLTNGVANFYLIQESGKLTLVDRGLRFPRPGEGRGDLDAVLLTHAHHTGFAEQARTTTGARVWIHEHDVQAARTGKVGPARPRRGGTGSTRSPAAAAGSGSASPTDPAPATCGHPPRGCRTGPLRSSLPGGTGCGLT